MATTKKEFEDAIRQINKIFARQEKAIEGLKETVESLQAEVEELKKPKTSTRSRSKAKSDDK